MFIGISLLLGFWVRFASVLGILHMLSLTLATWWQPGRGMPVWRYFGAELEHLPLRFLFVIFFVSDAGEEGAMSGKQARKSRSASTAGTTQTETISCGPYSVVLLWMA